MHTYRFGISERGCTRLVYIQAASMVDAGCELFGRGYDIRTVIDYCAVVDGEVMAIGEVPF